jgi:hypothetical protein
MREFEPLYRKKARRKVIGITAFVIVLRAFMFYLYKTSMQLGSFNGEFASVTHNSAQIANAGSDRTLVLPTNYSTLSGSGIDADGSIVSYKWDIVSGTGVIQNPSSRTTQVTDISPGFSIYRLTVTDDKGATDTAKVTVRLKYDTVQPSAQLTDPRNNSTVSGTTTLSVNATDDIGVDHVDFYKNDTVIGAKASAPYSFDWNTTTVPNGAYKIKAIAYDAANNSRVTNIITLNVKNMSTDTNISTGAPTPITPPKDTTAPNVSLSTASSTLSAVAALTATASDNIGISKVEFYDGSSFIATDTTATNAAYSVSWDTTKVSNGAHTLEAIAIDTSGNTKTSNILSVTVNNYVANSPAPVSSSSSPSLPLAPIAVTTTNSDSTSTQSKPANDTSAPFVALSFPTPGATLSNTVMITALASDNIGVDHVDFYQGSTFLTTDAISPYTYAWDTTKLPNGHYALSAIVYDKAGNKANAAAVSVMVKNTLPLPISSYQVGISFGDTLHSKGNSELNTIFTDLNNEGITWARFDLSWEDVQWNNSTSYDWSGLDRIVSDAAVHHLKLLPDIGYAPKWARISSCNSTDSCPPADVSAFATFVKAAVERYTPQGITNWEIWNEPNNWHFWSPRPDANAYTQLLKAGYTAVKSVNSSATVIAAGLSPAVNDSKHIAPIDFLKEMYANGARPYFDAIAMHPYAFPADPSQYTSWSAWSQMSQTNPSLRSVMTQYGDANKKIWLTEYGAPTGGPGTQAWVGYPDINDSSVDHVTDALQSQLIINGITSADAYSWAGPIFIYSYQDLGTATDTIENFFGIKRKNGTLKPVYTALKKLLI